jgi:hypothetical protein
MAWRIAAWTDSRSSNDSSKPASHSRPLDFEQIRAWRLGLQPALQRSVDLVLRARAPAHQLLAAHEATTQDAAALIGIHTASSTPFNSKVVSVGASSLSVFARALLIPCPQG